ncbi:class I SAM-dependent methyltransferase [Luteolibacter arcticus]|uniref:Class I SAM-dependent methyltransferase n=1 Tax=Luteolibacter arcticus TaxID=1581411 RepID=A0ABT3GBY5_9BACT|nr:class I SAM-dependent methyltransferase [Luteolibacter arcticus]MCW1921135.1 class I SAM-dependent methyltransferase [Luteolibacter arcticus]
MARVIPLLVLICVAAISAWAWFRSAEPVVLPPEPTPPPPAASAPAPAAVEVPYVTGPATPDGIGKFFYGREIAKVMGHPAIGWLERTEREQEEAPSKAIAAIELAPDAVIADIGAGSGYYSFRMSEKVPRGKVVALDIQPEMLDFLRKKAAELKISNVEPHLGAIDDVKLPAASLDAALMVDAYHEFSHPQEMLASLHRALKPGGRIFLLEFRGEDPKVPIKPLHKMTEAQARLELEGAGFRFEGNLRPLPWQHLMVFERP